MFYCCWKYGLWIRFFKRGIWIAVDDGSTLLFSERNGYRKVYRFLGIKIKIL
jgi:hypothetical protein